MEQSGKIEWKGQNSSGHYVSNSICQGAAEANMIGPTNNEHWFRQFESPEEEFGKDSSSSVLTDCNAMEIFAPSIDFHRDFRQQNNGNFAVNQDFEQQDNTSHKHLSIQQKEQSTYHATRNDNNQRNISSVEILNGLAPESKHEEDLKGVVMPLGRLPSGQLCPGTLECYHCSDLFGDPASLDAHIATQHSLPGTSLGEKCDFCPLYLKSLTNKKRHINNCHVLKPGQDKFIACPVCEATFSSLWCHKTHLRKFHLNDRDEQGRPYVTVPQKKISTKCFACKLCNVTFKEKNNLRRHVRTVHWRRYDYQCKVCGMSTSTKSNLAVHEQKHKKLRQSRNT